MEGFANLFADSASSGKLACEQYWKKFQASSISLAQAELIRSPIQPDYDPRSELEALKFRVFRSKSIPAEVWDQPWLSYQERKTAQFSPVYDPHWNIPKDYQANWLKYIFEEKLEAEEAGEILRVIEESDLETNDEDWLKSMKFNRNLLLQYLQERKKEEKAVRKKSARIKYIKANLWFEW